MKSDLQSEIRALTERAERAERERDEALRFKDGLLADYELQRRGFDSLMERALASEAALSRAREALRPFAAWACTRTFAAAGTTCVENDLDGLLCDTCRARAALAAAPDPSPVAGRDDEKKLTSEDRTDGER